MAKRKHPKETDEPPSKRQKVSLLEYSDSDSQNETDSDSDAEGRNLEETEEERRQRRLNKKLAKQAKIRENERENYFGYSNEDNPFGDSQLTSLFIWKKKYAQQGLKDKDIKKLQKERIKEKQQILKQEILKTKQRRAQREKEKELEEKLQAELAKEMELEENAGWKEKEEEFHQLNAVKRSQIRIANNRAKPIDILAHNIIQFRIDAKSKTYYARIANPIELIDNLSLYELAELLDDINQYLSENLVGDDEKRKDHWNMALLYAQYVFDKKQLIENDMENENTMDSAYRYQHPHDNHNHNANHNSSKSINESDLNIMNKIERENLSNQSYSQLIEFEDLCTKMVSGRAAEIDEKYAHISVDVNYWTLALKITKICKAKAFITKEHQAFKQKLETERAKKEGDHEMNLLQSNTNSNVQTSSEVNVGKFLFPELLQQEKINDDKIPMIDSAHSLYSSYKEKAMEVDEFMDELDELRMKVLKQSMERLQKMAAYNKDRKDKKHNNSNKEEKIEIVKNETTQIASTADSGRAVEMYEKESKRAMDEGEHSYNRSEEEIPHELRTKYWWHDKYRPRKPRYFNRVKTGYSWNKYNQTHYDPDNPPPKIVQGYKFNIFYPDLIDASTPPTYKVYTKGDGSEYAILVFRAGPPYEDIAFKIVNNEW
eukprot:CAMPEP_0197035306 /NCGR_PEP_ID=MMETSP1384-20130603/13148_1 /TAXON_ID=29189 /ORGANISM="Ammonia sp." /LENGTH=658 /DNA_ID=CAMNT_0042465353 /DNA_START=13 /DNA_END=1986 /DNA_ORIENTATION=+